MNYLKETSKAVNNKYDEWQDSPEECVALVMLLDQLSRNFYEIIQKHLNKIINAD